MTSTDAETLPQPASSPGSAVPPRPAGVRAAKRTSGERASFAQWELERKRSLTDTDHGAESDEAPAGELDHVETRLDAWMTECNRLRLALEETQAQLAAAQGQPSVQERRTLEVQRVQARLAAQAQSVVLESKAEQQAARADSAESKVGALQQQLQRQAERAEGKMGALQQQLQQQAARADLAETKAGALQEQLQQQADSAEAKLGALQAQLQQQAARADLAEAKAGALQEQLQQQADSAEAKLGALQQQAARADSAEEQLRALQAQLQQQAARANSAEEQLRALQEQLRALRAAPREQGRVMQGFLGEAAVNIGVITLLHVACKAAGF